jgi:hypothetical protein
MVKHYILNLNPNAKYEWDRCTLRDPISASHPALADLVAEAVGDRAGAYLVAVNLEVTVLEEGAITQGRNPSEVLELPAPVLPKLAELVA